MGRIPVHNCNQEGKDGLCDICGKQMGWTSDGEIGTREWYKQKNGEKSRTISKLNNQITTIRKELADAQSGRAYLRESLEKANTRIRVQVDKRERLEKELEEARAEVGRLERLLMTTIPIEERREEALKVVKRYGEAYKQLRSALERILQLSNKPGGLLRAYEIARRTLEGKYDI